MSPAPRRRTGFTLVELLVVIVIIGVLVGLLVPVIWGAVGRANDARVAAEINILSQALASFKTKFQEYPPSRIVLVENGGYNIANPPSPFYTGMNYSQPYPNIGDGSAANPDVDIDYPTLAQRSMTALRKFFPKIQVTTGGGVSSIPGGYYDFNGNSWNSQDPATRGPDPLPILLEGHECLTFFLGGIPNNDLAGSIYTLNGLSGFSANPRNPFSPPTPGNNTPRVGPFFEFAADRLVDDDRDGIPGYVDPLGTQGQARYFAYFSSYEGAGYDPNDVNLDGSKIGEVTSPGRQFLLSFPLSNAPNRTTISPLPNPYTSSLAVPAGSGAATFLQPQSYQIISAGRDRQYGLGGQYAESTQGTRLPEVGGGSRARERDNVTNFSSGTLD